MYNSTSFEANHFQDPSFVKSAETKYQTSSTTEMKLPPMQRPRRPPRLLIQDNLKERKNSYFNLIRMFTLMHFPQ